MEISFNWENISSNKYFENVISEMLTKNFSKFKYLNNLEISISKGYDNSRYIVKLLATTKNIVEKLRVEGISCDIIPATNDLIFNFINVLKNYDEKWFEKRQKLESKWEEDAQKNSELKRKKEEKYKAIIEENKRRIELNEKIRKHNEQIKRDYKIQKDLAKKIHKQQLIDEQTRYELEKDFLERQKELEEKRLLKEARLREVARIQKETIAKDLGLEEKAKEQQKTLRELKEKNNEVTKIKNKIINLESSYFDEIWQANEPFQNEETGQWYYHDGQGNFYESNENGEWVENTNEIKEKLESIKQSKIAELLIEKDKAQARQEKVSNNEYLNSKDNTLDAKTLENIEKKIDQDEEKLKQLIIDKENKILNINETHPANEPWLGDDNKYYYHDGNGKYFTTNENNEWVETLNPSIKEIEDEYNKQKDNLVNEEIKLEDSNNNNENNKNNNQESFLPKPNEAYEFDGKWYYFDENGNYYTTNENNEWVSTVNPHATGINSKNNDGETKALEDNYDHSEPFQDENGVWWYIDENNQYYYGDANGNWVKWEESK